MLFLLSSSKSSFNFSRTLNTSLHQLFNQIELLVFCCIINQILTLAIFPQNIYFTFFNKVINTISFLIFDSIENWCLKFVIKMISISSSLNKNFDYWKETLSCCIEYWSLSITINMVGLASIINEKFSKIWSAISWYIEKTSLIQRILHRSLAFSLFNEIRCHIICFLVILNKNTCEKSILLIACIIH